MSDHEMTLSEYVAEVASIASNVAKESIDEDRDPYEVLHEAIDGHQWIIYTSYNLDVLKHSKNECAYFENIGPVTAESFSELTAMLAYAALEADVQEVLPTIEECSECGKRCLEDDLDAGICPACVAVLAAQDAQAEA